ncbi:MAG TPA: hypothetical protein VN699_17935 [Pirellulales bacterium]|nr:hypothetical protein [Pirellulales bacterium]
MNTSDLLTVASGILALGIILCYLTFVIQTFMHGETQMGVICIVLTFCCIFGGLFTFGYGWWKVNEWENILLMSAWTCCIVFSLVLHVFMAVAQHPM